jgi:hypothetical protein
MNTWKVSNLFLKHWELWESFTFIDTERQRHIHVEEKCMK